MSFFSRYKGNARFWLKGYLLLGVAVMVLAMLFYSNHLINRMREHSESTSRLFSRYFANVLFDVTDDGKLAGLRSVIRESNLPIIITVIDGRPIMWHRVPVDESPEVQDMASDDDFESLMAMDLDNPPDKMRRLIELYREYDERNPPIPIRAIGSDYPVGYVHFGPSALERELRLMPFVQLGIFLIFMAVAIQGLRLLKVSEQRSIWVGLAKETAHQLGTPLSALLGWVQVIRDQAQEKGYEEILPSIREMEVDIGRLSKVTDRFSKIGSKPELKRIELRPVLERTVRYFEKRLPTLKSNSSIRLDIDGNPCARGNEELLEWVFENLIKNAVDALGEGGEISIVVDAGRKHDIDILVRDTGRGISPGLRDRVFRPGVTTKRRGWGLGLALSRRIVSDYHAGTIRLVESRPGKGTTFLVRLPAA